MKEEFVNKQKVMLEEVEINVVKIQEVFDVDCVVWKKKFDQLLEEVMNMCSEMFQNLKRYLEELIEV